MNDQMMVHYLRMMRKDHTPSDEILQKCRNIVLSQAGSGPVMQTGGERVAITARLREFSQIHLTPHALPVGSGIGMVLVIIAGIGGYSLRATPQNPLLYQIGSSLERVNIALRSENTRNTLEVALLSRGASDIDAVRGLSSSAATIQTVVGVVEGRFARVAGQLERISQGSQDYPFALLVNTAHSADATKKALAELRESAPVSLQPALDTAFSTVTMTGRRALEVMVTYSDKMKNGDEVRTIVKETLGKELASVQESIGSLVMTHPDQVLVNSAGDVLVQAQQELHDGNYKVTLTLINEAEGLVSKGSADVEGGVVEGESVGSVASNEFSTSTPPGYITSTDRVLETENNDEVPGDSRNPVIHTANNKVQDEQSATKIELSMPDEYSIGLDL